MKKAVITLVVLGAVGGGAYGYYMYSQKAPEPNVMRTTVTRGDIADTVGATGTVQAVTTVQVGTQVSGTIQELHADFNSLVRRGQVIARLDPSLFQTQVEQANANLIRAQADLERLKVTLDDARTKLARARELSAKKLIPQTELDTAEVTLRSTEAQIRSSQASVTQADASLNQNKVNLAHTVIEAPIDGIVISRNVDVGQTVAASMSAPTLFVLAADLTKMQVVANLDESDVGRIRPGQHVTFGVDAYPAENFTGTVGQVRLSPIVQQNVVTYATVINVPNPELKLKPGMTANVNIEIARRTDVVRVPNAALRFRPTPEIYAALGLTPPAAGQGNPGWADAARGGRGGQGSQGSQGSRGSQGVQGTQGSEGAQGQPAVPGRGEAAAAPAPTGERAAAPNLGRRDGNTGRGGTVGGGDPARMADRMQNLSAEDRQRMMERRGRGGEKAPETPARAGRGAAPSATRSLSASNPGATTIDALFGPLPVVESRGQVWLYTTDRQLRPVRLRLGISDGQTTELIEGELNEGDEAVTNVTTGQETRPAPGFPGGFPPFMGPGGRGGDFRGGPGGGGGGGGRGGRG
jgi:HlyD family secretion protein